MTIDRKDFLKKACISGACFCGFGKIAFSNADENKSYCVCPMVNRAEGIGSSVMCNCSEGFAEKMFSAVFGHPVKAQVISSVLKGNASCKYKITV
jgi:predicted ArsR family transcriptional regulator